MTGGRIDPLVKIRRASLIPMKRAVVLAGGGRGRAEGVRAMGVADCVAVTEAHRRLWPGKLAP